MNRAKLILSLAINEKLLQSQDAAKLLINFSQAKKNDQSITFEDIVVENELISEEQINDITQKFNEMRVKCKKCDEKIDIADLPVTGNWVCPNCNSTEFNLVKVKKSKTVTEKQPIHDVPPTLADRPISKLYDSQADDNQYLNKTNVPPSDKNIEFAPAIMDNDFLVAPADDAQIDVTVADGNLIHTDSFEVKDSNDTSRDKVLIAKDDMIVDSNERVKFKDDEGSQLIPDQDVFTPAENNQTLLQARRTSDKLPELRTSISNRTAIAMNGQEVIHKGITPESLEKGLQEGAILDGFEILGILGRGGMGIVYNGHDLALNRRVAIKVLSPNILQNETQLKRFEIEAQACAALEHHNVVNIYRFGTIYNHPYIVMQFIDGKSLNEIIKEDGELPVEQAIDYVIQAAQGLREAHHRNIIHRDIKPDNLLVDNRGTVKILDFGLAKQTTSDAQLSQSGYFLGTPAYISPEQASGDPADLRADIYSLGISAFQMLTGKLPFTGTAAQVVTAHLIQELPSIKELNPECPLSLETAIRKMSAKSPDERFQTMDDVIEALELVKKEITGEIRVNYPKKRKPVLAIVLFIFALLIIGGGVGLYLMGILDPVIEKLTGKKPTPVANTGDVNTPPKNDDTNNPNPDNGTNGKTAEEIKAEAEMEKQKGYKTRALKIINYLAEGFWTDEFDEKREIDKDKLDEYEIEFKECIENISEETERLNLQGLFSAQKSKYIDKWSELEKENARGKLNEFIKTLQKFRVDTTATIEDIDNNLKKIDTFTNEIPDSAAELDKFITDLQTMRKSLEKLESLNEKSEGETDLQVLLNYLEVLGEIVKGDGKNFKFEDRDDVKASKFNLTKVFEEQMNKKNSELNTVTDETELDNLKSIIDEYAQLTILNPKEKQKYDFVLENIEARRKDIKRNDEVKKIREDLIQEIEENMVEQDLEKMRLLQKKITRNETDYPELVEDEAFKNKVNELENMILQREGEEEEFQKIRNFVKKLSDRCNEIDIKDKTKIAEMRILKQDIEAFIDENKETLTKINLKKESAELQEMLEKCIEYLRMHTVEIYTNDDEKEVPWQLEKAGSFKGELFNIRLQKLYSKFAWRQPARITCMQYVKTGNTEYLITGSVDKTIRLWDLKNFREVRILKNEASVTSLAYKITKNQDLIVFAGLQDGTIAVWNPIYEKVKNYSTIHTAKVTSIVMLNNSALSASEDKTVVGWSYKEETQNIEGKVTEEAELIRSELTITHPGIVHDIAVSPDKTRIATACGDHKIRIYSMDGALEREITEFLGSVLSVSFEPREGKILAAGGEEKNVKLLTVENGTLFAELKGHKFYVTNVKYDELGRLFTTSFDNTSILWNIEKREPEITFDSKIHYTDFVFTKDNHIIFSGDDGGFCKFRMNNGERVFANSESHENMITGIAKINDKELMTTSIDGKIYIWNLEEDTVPVLFELKAPAGDVENTETKPGDKKTETDNLPITSFSIDKTGKYAVFGRLDGSAFLVALETKTVIKYWDLAKHIDVAKVVVINKDDSTEVVCIFGTKGGQVSIKSLNSSIDELLTVQGNKINGVAVSNSGLLAIAGYSSTVFLYDLMAKKEYIKIENKNSNSVVTAVAFSDDGKIAVGSKEQDVGVVRIYNLTDGSLVSTYSELEISVVSLNFVIDDSTVLAVDGSSKIKAFKINEDGSNREIFSANIGSCGDIITSVFIDNDFSMLIFGTSRGAVLAYEVEKK